MRGRRVLLLWWFVVLVAILGLGLVSIVMARDEPPPSVVRVVGDGPDLWASTNERVLLQGVDTAWWVSHDGGLTWTKAEPPAPVERVGSVTEACNPSGCYRLVDGSRVERRSTGEASWEVEHERPQGSSPTGYDGYRRDWEEEPSIATTDRSDLDEVVVAAGRDGVVVRTENGGWDSVSVGESLVLRYLPWVSAVLAAIVLLVGVVGHLVIRWWTRRVRPPSVGDSQRM